MGSLLGGSTLPYWQVNVPPDEREEKCPPFLLNANDKDVAILLTPDSEYEPMSWPQLQRHIAQNRLDVFQRTPFELRRYLAFNYRIKMEYGSVMNFILSEKLHWKHPIVADGAPFEKASDLSIKWNDWPYGIDQRVAHLVVWTKFALEEDPMTGDLSRNQRNQINDYVEKIFRVPCGKDNVIWFRNWASLKSVHSVEHFHVMLFNADPKFLNKITGGDIPLSQTTRINRLDENNHN